METNTTPTTVDTLPEAEGQAIQIPKNITIEQLRLKVKSEKEAALGAQRRKWVDWTENYTLLRDRPQLNRLTQRQDVCIPLMRETISTVLSRVDEPPEATIESKDGDDDKTLIMQEKWNNEVDDKDIELIDIVTKKQVLIYGRTHYKHNFKNNEWVLEIKDAYDVVVDPQVNPINIQSARHIHELHIYRPVLEIVNDTTYDKDARTLIRGNYLVGDLSGGRSGAQLVQNFTDATIRNQRLEWMGATATDLNSTGYDIILELNQHYTLIWDESKKCYEKYVVVTAMDSDYYHILKAKPLEDAISIKDEDGNQLFPFDSWASDPDATDYWADAVADIVRTPNKLINAWLSQLTENRTLVNFGMNYYDSTAADDWVPTGYSPRPGAWFPLPGKPGDVYQHVDIEGIDGVIDEINFVIGIVERATATGALDKGVVEQGKRTLGEVEIAVTKSMERTTSMSKYYQRCWKQIVQKWTYIVSQNEEGESKRMYKKNQQTGKLQPKDVTKTDWYSAEGYKVTIESYNQRMSKSVDELQRLNAVKPLFSEGNQGLTKAIQRRALTIIDLTMDERREINDFEKQALKAVAQATSGSGDMPLPPELEAKIAEAIGTPGVPITPSMPPLSTVKSA
jgi:hypothetical protein